MQYIVVKKLHYFVKNSTVDMKKSEYQVVKHIKYFKGSRYLEFTGIY